MELGDIFRSAVMVLIPVAVTGGIHLDGLLAVSYTHLDLEQIDALAEVSGVKVPGAIEEIRTAPVRYHREADVDGMEDAVKQILGLK